MMASTTAAPDAGAVHDSSVPPSVADTRVGDENTAPGGSADGAAASGACRDPGAGTTSAPVAASAATAAGDDARGDAGGDEGQVAAEDGGGGGGWWGALSGVVKSTTEAVISVAKTDLEFLAAKADDALDTTRRDLGEFVDVVTRDTSAAIAQLTSTAQQLRGTGADGNTGKGVLSRDDPRWLAMQAATDADEEDLTWGDDDDDDDDDDAAATAGAGASAPVAAPAMAASPLGTAGAAAPAATSQPAAAATPTCRTPPPQSRGAEGSDDGERLPTLDTPSPEPEPEPPSRAGSDSTGHDFVQVGEDVSRPPSASLATAAQLLEKLDVEDSDDDLGDWGDDDDEEDYVEARSPGH